MNTFCSALSRMEQVLYRTKSACFDRVHLSIAFLQQRADDFLGVVSVHLAAEGFEVKRFLRIALGNPRHIGKV